MIMIMIIIVVVAVVPPSQKMWGLLNLSCLEPSDTLNCH
jgi:hypothetical protein